MSKIQWKSIISGNTISHLLSVVCRFVSFGLLSVGRECGEPGAKGKWGKFKLKLEIILMKLIRIHFSLIFFRSELDLNCISRFLIFLASIPIQFTYILCKWHSSHFLFFNFLFEIRFCRRVFSQSSLSCSILYN